MLFCYFVLCMRYYNLVHSGMFGVEETIDYDSLFKYELGFFEIYLELKIDGVSGTAF